MAPTLSVCVMTPGPPERVRALLEVVRAAADEIVLVVDAGGDAATLDACEDLADRRFHVDCSSVVTALGWMLHRCRGDWILRLDDDEVPSAALLEALPDLIADPFPTNMAIRRRWLFPDERTHVATRPWRPDYQVRLVRNVPGAWSFPGLVHGALEVLGERRFCAEAIYHADCLLQPVDARRAKRDRFARARPGLVTAEGLGVNEIYVPEDHDVETAPVPPEDRALIERVLAGSRPSARGPALDPSPRSVARAEIELPTRSSVSPGAYAARVAVEEPPARLRVGEARVTDVVVENHGDDWWHPGDAPPFIRLGCRWLHPATGAPAGSEERALLTETVLPGESTRVALRLVAPATPGRYLLEVDLVHEHVRWFGCGERSEVLVVSGPGRRRAPSALAPGRVWRSAARRAAPLLRRG